MTRTWLALLSAAVIFVAPPFVGSQDFPYRGDESFDGKVKSPVEFFGVPLGDRFTPHHDVMRYCRYLAESSPRVKLEVYGRSGEGRELVLLTISTQQNIARLDEIRDLQGKLSDPRRLEGSEGELDGIIERLPVVSWMSYNVHGNESSGTEAALQVLYYLVDGNDAVAKKIRERCVTIVDPLLNPDGRERYLQWYHSVAQTPPNPDPASREHSEPWPGGRTNHYYFDLNRDWAWLSQPESRARVVPYLKWQPLVHVDVHEMSSESTYFFFPAEEPVNLNYPEHTRSWGKILGRGNATAFDRFGWLYYTTESFDLFYPGYGDSWPSLHGAIGMTFEQAGGARGGLRVKRRDGTMLTLSQRLHHHVVASLATLETSVDRKEELQRSFHEFRKSAVELGQSGKVVEYLIPPAGSPERLEGLVQLLIDQGIEVERATKEFVAESISDYFGETKELVKLPAGTYIVPVGQPAGRLAKALLEPEAKVTELRFYDISAWSLPLASGVDAYFTATKVDVERVSVTAITPAAGSVSQRAGYAYLLPWKGKRAARALHDLQSAGVTVRLVPEPVKIEEQSFERGTLMVMVAGNPEGVHDIVAATAMRRGVTFVGVATGWTDEGIDLGSDRVRTLRAPRIAVASGSGVSSGAYGAVWALFERDLGIPFTAFDLDDLGRLDFEDYNVLVMPSGFGYRARFDEATVTRIGAWVRDGGVVVAMSGAAFAATAEQSKLTRISAKPPKSEPKKEEPTRKKIEDLRKEREKRQVPGNIFRVDLDQEHVLAFGLPQHVYALMSGTRSFALSGGSGDVGAFTDDPAVSGYITEESIAQLRRRVFLAEESRGRGAFVLFAGDPNFRLFWRGLTPLFLNAVFLRAGR